MKPIVEIAPLSVLLSATILLSACAPGSFLARANEDCRKYDTPDAQMACERKVRETAKAFESYQEKSRRSEKEMDDEGQKKNRLCFKQSSGELLCPNP